MKTADITQTYSQHFGEAPELIVRAPGRINLIGEHTDYNDGFVLPGAIDKAIWFAAGRRTDGRFAIYAKDIQDFYLSESAEVKPSPKTWANYLLGTISEARKDGFQIGGLNIVFTGDVPLGAGLSSSAALESGMAFILDRLFRLSLEKIDIIRLAQRSENNFVGMRCGIMDMFASVMGRKNSVMRLDCRSLIHEYFPFEMPEYRIVLSNTGVKHALVNSEYNKRREECEAGVGVLKKINPDIISLRDASPDMVAEAQKSNLFRENEKVFDRCAFVVAENERVLEACLALKNNNIQRVGDLMYTTHEGLRDLYEVSCPEADLLVAGAKRFDSMYPGSVPGARMMGGGFGGCTINLVQQNHLPEFKQFLNRIFRETFNRPVEHYDVALSNGVEEIGRMNDER